MAALYPIGTIAPSRATGEAPCEGAVCLDLAYSDPAYATVGATDKPWLYYKNLLTNAFYAAVAAAGAVWKYSFTAYVLN